MFVYNGADLEHWAEDVLDTLENQDLVVSEASDGVELLDGGHDHAHGDEEKIRMSGLILCVQSRK